MVKCEEEQLDDVGLLNLIIAILRITAQDIRYGNNVNREDALEFLESDLFEDICFIFNMDMKKVKNLILTSSIRQRKKYES